MKNLSIENFDEDLLIELIDIKNKNNYNISKLKSYINLNYNFSIKLINLYISKIYDKKDKDLLLYKKSLLINEFYNKINKTDLINKLCDIGGTYNSNNHLYNYIKFSYMMIKVNNENLSNDIINNINEY